ncbi:hypothetical protein E2C01_057256 [Portunus trituberculatus]|uniref:Uncharacterized protein n=1 Tax=Portunus trituberculatus TaxID=210409 RepID=A0A5B7GWA9_PORTR|nr:hypothetical protein [Portunus trituberculatus]
MTSRLFGIGKSIPRKKMDNEHFRQQAAVFCGTEPSSHDAVTEVDRTKLAQDCKGYLVAITCGAVTCDDSGRFKRDTGEKKRAIHYLVILYYC